MHNYFSIETEAEMRRQEWERAAAADARAALASPAKRKRNWLPLGIRSLGNLNLPAPNVPRPSAGALLELRRVPRPVAC